jgi:hypothetical protein
VKFVYENDGIPHGDRQKLRDEVLTLKNPLGAPFLELYGSQDQRLFQYLFDGHSAYLYERFGERPSILVGRKGSGKTTYLNNILFKDGVIGIPIATWIIMDEVTDIIKTMIEQGIDVRAERASYIWQWLFLNAILLSSRKIIDKNSIDEIAKMLPTKEYAEIGIAAITSFLKEKVKQWVKLGQNADLASVAFILEDKSTAIDKLERELSSYLADKEKIAVILLDNEENFLSNPKPKKQEEAIREARKSAISGLLNYCGRANEGAINVQVRYCIPAEQFHAFKDFSESTGKDFSNLHLLHWTVGELLSMIAHRYMLYLYVWKDIDTSLEKVYRELVGFEIYSRQGALDFFHKVLPDEISNGRVIPEKSLTYILRHFQVLPRQLITVFNTIVGLTIREKRSLLSIDKEIIKRAVHSREASMAEEIIRAYKVRYPEASKIVKKVLPNIPLIFNYRDIRSFYDGNQFRNKGKDVLTSYRGEVEISPDRFERCLVETGIIGRVIDKPRVGRLGYINAEFEYSMPSTLDLCEEDQLVIHPIFSGQRLAAAIEQFGENIIGVYPHDADPDKELDRDYMSSVKFTGQ